MEYTSTTHGKQMIIDGNYLYVFQKDLANDVQSWECQLRRRHVCKANNVQKRTYADCAARVLNIVEDYPQRRGNIITYLEAIAYNLSF